MSSILLSSPFPAPPVVPAAIPDGSGDAVIPIGGTALASSSGHGTSFSGSGSGFGAGSGTSNQDDTVALFRTKGNSKWERPADATGGSVIDALTQESTIPETLGPDLPEVEMPDPLPTSPFLKQDEFVA